MEQLQAKAREFYVYYKDDNVANQVDNQYNFTNYDNYVAVTASKTFTNKAPSPIDNKDNITENMQSSKIKITNNGIRNSNLLDCDLNSEKSNNIDGK